MFGCTPEPAPPIEPWVIPSPSCVAPAVTAVTLSDNDEMVLEKRFAITQSEPAPLVLQCTSPDDPLEDHSSTLVPPEQELRLYGVLADTRYDCVLVDACGEVAWTESFTTAPLPEGLPELVVTGDPAAATLDDGYVLFSHWLVNSGPKVHRMVVVDGTGTVRWYQDFPEATTGGITATWLGDQMVVGGGAVVPSLRDLSGDIAFEVGAALYEHPGGDIYHHEAQMTSSGVLSLQRVPDGNEEIVWDGFLIQVTDPVTAAVVWAFDSRDARREGILPPGSRTLDDPYHANAVTWRDDDPDGPAVWVSLKAMQALMRVDRTTGAITFVGREQGITLVDPAGALLPNEAWFFGQHAPWYDGADVWVYDNGNARPGVEYSRVARFRRDSPEQMTLLWEWTEPDWFEPNYGGVVLLPSGHVLVATGHCPSCEGTGGHDDTGWILELDPATDAVVWRFDFPTWRDSTYRAQAIDGCDLFANRRFCTTAYLGGSAP